jgi:hypothetical protein
VLVEVPLLQPLDLTRDVCRRASGVSHTRS